MVGFFFAEAFLAGAFLATAFLTFFFTAFVALTVAFFDCLVLVGMVNSLGDDENSAR
jgi:hypothetical protein